MARRVSPLGWNVPIVDDKGRPTREFAMKFAQQQLVNLNIPALSTPEQVSDVLDVLAATPGSILRRGMSQWQGLGTDNDPAKFLNAAGAYDVPPNTTYGVVTDTAPGLAPQLPADATMYLDGTGVYSVPAGGGGGYTPWFMEVSPQSFLTSGTSGGGNLFFGFPVMPLQNVTLTGIRAYFRTLTGSTSVYAAVYAAVPSAALAGGSLVAQGVSAIASTNVITSMPLTTPIVLSAGTIYYIGFVLLGGAWATAAVSNTNGAFFAHATATAPATAPAATYGAGNRALWGY